MHSHKLCSLGCGYSKHFIFVSNNSPAVLVFESSSAFPNIRRNARTKLFVFTFGNSRFSFFFGARYSVSTKAVLLINCSPLHRSMNVTISVGRQWDSPSTYLRRVKPTLITESTGRAPSARRTLPERPSFLFHLRWTFHFAASFCGQPLDVKKDSLVTVLARLAGSLDALLIDFNSISCSQHFPFDPQN